jgi:hypothetical protein
MVEELMAQRHKVSIRTQTDSYRLTSDERRAARFAEVAGKHEQLKQEAAARRVKRAEQADAKAPGEPR